MLSSISPVGETARGQRWSITVSAYLLASAVAGAGLGLLLGALGMLALGRVPAARLWALGAVAVIGLALDRAGRVPSRHRQVDERWLTTYRGWVYGAGFGAQLGTGVVTIVPASVVWVMWAAALLVADARQGLLVGLAFGLVRALPLVLAGRARTVARLRTTMSRMARLRDPATRVTAAGHVAVAAASVLLAVRATL